jgi:hypothetical protein
MFPNLNLSAAVEGTVCSLILSGQRIQAIRVLRENAPLGLAEAKTEVDRAALSMGAPRLANAGCYIATACYGDYDHPHVRVLRRFRDERLARTARGRLAVRLYYAVSPALASHLGRHPRITSLIRRRMLEPLVERLRNG